jgi:hypothetical protein
LPLRSPQELEGKKNLEEIGKNRERKKANRRKKQREP